MPVHQAHYLLRWKAEPVGECVDACDRLDQRSAGGDVQRRAHRRGDDGAVHLPSFGERDVLFTHEQSRRSPAPPEDDHLRGRIKRPARRTEQLGRRVATEHAAVADEHRGGERAHDEIDFDAARGRRRRGTTCETEARAARNGSTGRWKRHPNRGTEDGRPCALDDADSRAVPSVPKIPGNRTPQRPQPPSGADGGDHRAARLRKTPPQPYTRAIATAPTCGSHRSHPGTQQVIG